MRYSIEGIKNLFEDFTNAIRETEVNLRNAKIVQVKEAIEYDNTYSMIKILGTDVKTLVQEEQTKKVRKDLSDILWRIGCYYEVEVDKKVRRFIPTDDVQGRVMYDYFNKITAYNTVNAFSEPENALNLAKSFANTGKIIFIARRPIAGFELLIGIKACCSQKSLRAVDIANHLVTENSVFYSDYAEQNNGKGWPNAIFMFEMYTEGWSTDEGYHLSLHFSDSATAREAIHVDVLVNVSGQKFVIDTYEVSHRKPQKDGKKIASEILSMLYLHRTDKFNVHVPKEQLINNYINLLPQKVRSEAIKKITVSNNPSAVIANILLEDNSIYNKQYRTGGYDAGKRKVQLALGKLICA